MQKQLPLNAQYYHLDHTDILQAYNISPGDKKNLCVTHLTHHNFLFYGHHFSLITDQNMYLLMPVYSPSDIQVKNYVSQRCQLPLQNTT